MSKLRIFVTSVFTLALALGVWTLAAVNFADTSASFSDGDVLQASELNDLFNTINANFADAETQINANEAALADQVSRSGDSMSGRLTLSADAESSGSGDPASVFTVENTSSDTGSAAVFTSANDSNAGAVNIKQAGSGPALTLKASGTGPLISALGGGSVTFIAEQDGSIKIGDMGSSGTDDPTLHLDAANGTITNQVGSGLPVAFGTVDSDGSYLSGTTNWTATRNDSFPRYEIEITGEQYTYTDYTTVVTPVSGGVSTQTGSGSNELFVYLYNDAGTQVQGRFAFVTYAHLP